MDYLLEEERELEEVRELEEERELEERELELSYTKDRSKP